MSLSLALTLASPAPARIPLTPASCRTTSVLRRSPSCRARGRDRRWRGRNRGRPAGTRRGRTREVVAAAAVVVVAAAAVVVAVVAAAAASWEARRT